MKLSDLKDIRVDRLTQSELEKTHAFLKRTFNRSMKTFERKGLEPTTAREAKNELTHAEGLNRTARMQAEVSAMRSFYFTKKPGDRYETRSMSSTVAGYKEVLEQTGRNLGIDNYASNEWTEEQRQDLWNIIDRVREIGSDRVLPAGFGSYLYQSGQTFKTITVLIRGLHMDDPVEILEMLDARIDAIENGNTMTDQEFFGIVEEQEEQ